MGSASFYTALLFSLAYAAIVIAEAKERTALEESTYNLHSLQVNMVRVEKTTQLTQQIVRRMAVDSAHDPALTDLLQKYGVKVSFNDTQEASPSSPGTTDENHKPSPNVSTNSNQ
jgi:hypothetical protein